jgi:hypothetical protein
LLLQARESFGVDSALGGGKVVLLLDRLEETACLETYFGVRNVDSPFLRAGHTTQADSYLFAKPAASIMF